MDFNKLNEMQIKAVKAIDGPVLILAGAGSGKTTVLVNRIAYMMEYRGISPYNILAITFTNKAANEMKTRVENLIGSSAEGMWISTFHSCCVKILRSCIEYIGFSSNFVIYDSDDSRTVIKDCLKELNMDEKVFNPRAVAAQLSKAKDELISWQDYKILNENNYRLSKIASVYELYQKKLFKNNALDFDDIIFFTVKIFQEYEEVLMKYRQRFRYIMVDEYQDTSTAQYLLISLLAKETRNICVVGDDDQSIYKFRGANIRNILDFEKEFDDAQVIKLEQNYRSSQNILNAANSVIKNNIKRKSKSLWTSNEKGENIKIFIGNNERDEAAFVAKEIDKAVGMGAKYSDFAILYRTNAQSRVIEDEFIKNVVPYRVLSGLRFYDRKEIKDIIAYLRVILNPDDDVSLLRIINEPKRGIGKTTMDKAAFLGSYHNKSIFNIISEPDKYPDIIRSSSKLLDFCGMITELRSKKDSMPIVKLIEKVLNVTGYLSALELEKTIESQARIENIKEFISVAAEFEKNEEDASFEGFLENISLVSSIDLYEEEQDYVVMMTIHSAKGLEFENVFIIGLEEGLFPSLKGVSEEQDREDLEEERRLCYVAITRAKKRLCMSYATCRTIYGKTVYQRPSRFIKEIESQIKTDNKRSKHISVNSFINSTAEKTKSIIGMKPVVKPHAEDMKAASDFSTGDIVYHKKFGRGMVINAKKYGKDTLVEIAFDNVGTKQLMANFAKLVKQDE